MMQSPLIAKQRGLYGLNTYVGRPTPLRGGKLGFFSGSPVVGGAVGVVKGAATGASLGGAALGATTALGGAAAGAAAGSVVPVIGTAIGAIAGLIASGVLNQKQDPENYNFNQAVAIWQANRLNVLNIANKYLVLAGLFDLNIKTNIPIYKKYGHMGEERFTHDLAMLIYNAAQSGKITASDTPQTVMVKVVQPWIDSWGFGPMADPHADMINLILTGMVADYVSGSAPKIWRAVKGDLPKSFASIPPFSLPTAAGNTVANTSVVAPTTAITTAPISAVTTVPGAVLNPVAATSPSSQTVTVALPSTATTVAVPAGFSLVGTANGLQAYQGLDSNIYSWTGTSMQLLTGILTLTTGSIVQVVNGQVQATGSMSTPSLNYAGQQSYNTSAAPYYDPSQSAAVAQPATPGTAPAQPAAAGVSGLPSWVVLAGAAFAAYYIFSGKHKKLMASTASKAS